jgi:hypothetical protein
MAFNILNQIKNWDILKFNIYFIIFFILFFVYNKAQSPFIYTEYNSASVYFKEEIVLKNNKKQEEEVVVLKNNEIKEKKEEEIIPIIINFNPKDIKIDDKIIKMLKLVVNSKFFNTKVLPINILINQEQKDPRWQVSWNKLILSSHINNYNETLKVFVHELWHIVDIYYLKNKWWVDLSDKFYNISWIDYNIKKKDAGIDDFVSWYSLSNKYEDFAESFVFYVFHNDDFFARTKNNQVLRQKYSFFKKYIFKNEDFINTSFSEVPLNKYNWDSTKILINLKKYLYYIK